MKKKDKSSLVRIVRSLNGEVSIDYTGKADGRGAYLCKDLKCIENAVKRNSLKRTLKCDIPEKIYNMLTEGAENEKSI